MGRLASHGERSPPYGDYVPTVTVRLAHDPCRSAQRRTGIGTKRRIDNGAQGALLAIGSHRGVRMNIPQSSPRMQSSGPQTGSSSSLLSNQTHPGCGDRYWRRCTPDIRPKAWGNRRGPSRPQRHLCQGHRRGAGQDNPGTTRCLQCPPSRREAIGRCPRSRACTRRPTVETRRPRCQNHDPSGREGAWGHRAASSRRASPVRRKLPGRLSGHSTRWSRLGDAGDRRSVHRRLL